MRTDYLDATTGDLSWDIRARAHRRDGFSASTKETGRFKRQICVVYLNIFKSESQT